MVKKEKFIICIYNTRWVKWLKAVHYIESTQLLCIPASRMCILRDPTGFLAWSKWQGLLSQLIITYILFWTGLSLSWSVLVGPRPALTKSDQQGRGKKRKTISKKNKNKKSFFCWIFCRQKAYLHFSSKIG